MQGILYKTTKKLNIMRLWLFIFQLNQVWTSPYPSNLASVALKRNSPYTEFLKIAIYRLLENGAIDAFFKRAEKAGPACDKNSDKKSLGFSKMASLFLILLSGSFISLLSLIYENCKKSIVKNKNNTVFENEQGYLNIEGVVLRNLDKLKGDMKTEAISFLDKIQLIYKMGKFKNWERNLYR